VSVRKVILIRHTEKPDPASGILGVNDCGQPDSRSLSVKGWLRAGALFNVFDARGGDGIERPQSIVACRPDTSSARSYYTVRALAERFALDVDVRFGHGEEKELVAALETMTGVVLIAWKHRGFPKIAAHLARGRFETPAEWSPQRFDPIWIFERPSPGADWTFRIESQALFPEDRADAAIGTSAS
jgi:hypothetical protein